MVRFKHLRAEAEERFLRLHAKAWTLGSHVRGRQLGTFLAYG
jgi:hypothetical protein